jgi:predicted O-methyltransferase YrrM
MHPQSLSTLLDEIHERGEVTTPAGKVIIAHGAISREEGDFLAELIRNHETIARTLEIGCAFGASALHICAALAGRKDAHHIIIDPNQSTDYESVGVMNLRRAGVTWFTLIEEGSEFALPRLVAEGERRFDLIFIDGWHTFDHTLIDCFYATRLLRVGGYLVIDDATFASVSATIRHLETYPCYERYGGVELRGMSAKARLAKIALSIPPLHRAIPYLSGHVQEAIGKRYQMVALRKRAEDTRPWDWHVDF